MKNLVLVGLLAFILFVSCEEDPASLKLDKKKEAYISIIATEEFINDPVRISLDGNTLVDKNLTTDNSIGVAWASGLKKYEESLTTIDTEVKDISLKKSFVFQLKDTMTVTIRYDRIKKQIHYDTLKGYWILN